ncbi:MAG: twin-arginine translocase TatA/TatE family subunit [Planctomycetota bacterium]|jgi:sec-independent protein translocase protein TatA
MATPYVMALFGGFGMWEILLVVAIILLLFGASRIPELARSLGKGVDEFKKGLRGEPENGRESLPREDRSKALEDKDGPEEQGGS